MKSPTISVWELICDLSSSVSLWTQEPLCLLGVHFVPWSLLPSLVLRRVWWLWFLVGNSSGILVDVPSGGRVLGKMCSGIGSWLSGMRRTLRRGAEVIHRKEGKRMFHHNPPSPLGMWAGREERLQQMAATGLGTRLGAEEGRWRPAISLPASLATVKKCVSSSNLFLLHPFQDRVGRTT